MTSLQVSAFRRNTSNMLEHPLRVDGVARRTGGAEGKTIHITDVLADPEYEPWAISNWLDIALPLACPS